MHATKLVDENGAATRSSQARHVGRLPDFIVIGGMKSGTTTLYDYLSRHRSIFMCYPKEPMFFSRDHVYKRGIDWYQALFAKAEPGQICGEASTCYSRAPHFGDVPARIARHVPQAKLIYIMRHPVERAYSHYRHSLEYEHRDREMTFEQALQEDASICDASCYMRQIEAYLRFFRRDQMLLLLFDDLVQDPAAVLSEVQQFLGIEAGAVAPDQSIHANAGPSTRIRQSITKALRRLRRWPVVAQVADLMPQRVRQRTLGWLVDGVMSSPLRLPLMRRRSRRYSPLLPQTRAQLLAGFKDTTGALEMFLDRKLPAWHR